MSAVLSPQVRSEFAVLANELSRRKQRNRLSMYFNDEDYVDQNGVKFPARDKYPKHLEFFARGKDTFARMFLAAVGGGKTEALLYELSCHARGWYPHWWTGVRYNRPLSIWVCGKTIRSVRDILQTKWIGQPNLEAVGGGILPVEWLDLGSISRLSQGSIDSFRIKREDGTTTHIGFKAYEQGVGSFYGTDKDIVAYDEPCPVAIYAQGLMRTRNRENARVMYTVAALEGKTETVKLFMDEPDQSRAIVTCSWDEVPHLDETWKRNTLANTPMYLRDSVRTGVPSRGQGAVYPVLEKDFVIDPIPIPKHWLRAWAMDGGYHNTAGVWGAYDKDSGTAYIVSDYKDGGEGTNAGLHAARFLGRNKAFGFEKMPGVGDASAVSQIDGKKLLDEYLKFGLNLKLASKGVDAGISKVLTMLSEGRLKVFSTCEKLLDEFRSYAYKLDDEQRPTEAIVKINDHCLHPDTLVITRAGKVAIRDLVGTVGEVLSIGGYKAYRNCRMTAAEQEIVEVMLSDGSSVKCTPDHRFMTPRGWVEARDLVGEICENTIPHTIQEDSPWSPSYLLQSKSSKASVITCAANTSSEARPATLRSGFMSLYGRLVTACHRLKGFTFTTKTKTDPTITRIIWSFLVGENTCRTTARAFTKSCLMKRSAEPLNGINHRLALSGIGNITSDSRASCTSMPNSPAISALSHSPRRSTEAIDSARTTARAHGVERQGWIRSRLRALFAVSNSARTNTAGLPHVDVAVAVKCVEVREAGRSDVYCLTVPDTEAFAVENGVIVHNCMDAWRYLIMDIEKIAALPRGNNLIFKDHSVDY